MTELETSARPGRKRMTNHNTPQLSGMDSANHCAAFPGLSALSTTTVLDQTALTYHTYSLLRCWVMVYASIQCLSPPAFCSTRYDERNQYSMMAGFIVRMLHLATAIGWKWWSLSLLLLLLALLVRVWFSVGQDFLFSFCIIYVLLFMYCSFLCIHCHRT
jgi:hypothetical protein